MCSFFRSSLPGKIVRHLWDFRRGRISENTMREKLVPVETPCHVQVVSAGDSDVFDPCNQLHRSMDAESIVLPNVFLQQLL